MRVFKLCHTHPNPEFGKKRDAPALLVIEMPREVCPECQKNVDANVSALQKTPKQTKTK
jgi:hypothetical protein